MDAEAALEIVEQILNETSLSKVQKLVFRQTWQDLSYQEIAKDAGYELGYIKQAGSQLWQQLSQALGEKVNKANVQQVLKKYERARRQEVESKGQETSHPIPHTDWGEAPDVSIFYDRQSELTTLQRWILQDNCRLIGLFGVGGIGKTSLSVKLAQQFSQGLTEAGEQKSTHPLFEFIIWRSLRNAPPLQDLLADLLHVLLQHSSSQLTNGLPSSLDGRLRCLLENLRVHRCLLVLDNCETLMQQGDRSGDYQPGYEAYGELWRYLGEAPHQSCLVLTSREKPKGFATLSGDALPVRSLQLSGLSQRAGHTILNLKGAFFPSDDTWRTLVTHYGGNPLALKMVATAIADLFAGDGAQFLTFLQQGSSIFGDIRDLLAQQINRLSSLEQQVMVWLAVQREPMRLFELQADGFPPVSPSHLLEALAALEGRSLIEKRRSGFTLQPVVMEYITEQLIEQICREILQIPLTPQLLKTHALLKAQAKDYVREAQTRLILKPIVDRLLQQVSLAQLKTQLKQAIAQLQHKSAYETGYAAGNLINLMGQMPIHLHHQDFSHLIIWQAYLRKSFHGVNFTGSDLAKSVFTDTFSQILCIAFSPDSCFLAAGDVNHEIHLWRIADGQKVLTCKVEEGWVWSIAFSPDGKTLASSANRSIHLWDIPTGQCLKTLGSYTGRIFSVAFSPDGSLVASGGEDHLVRIWNIQSGELLHTFAGHTDEIRSVTFSPDGNLLASGSYDHTIRLWKVVSESTDLPSAINCQLLTVNQQPLHILTGHTNWVWSIAFSPDGTHLASSSSDRTLKRWDIQTGKCVAALTGHTQTVRTLAYSPDGQSLISGSDDRTLKLWHLSPLPLTSSSTPHTLIGHTSWISCVTFSPNGEYFASSSEDQSVRLWSSQTHHCLKVLQGYSNGIWSVAFSPDGQTIASGSQDRTVRLWHLSNSTPPTTPPPTPHTLTHHTSWIWSVAFHPTGDLLASGSEDCTIALWHPETRQLLHCLKGHHNAVFSLCFTLDGKTLISGSLDGTVKLWQVETGYCYQTLKGHQGGIWSVALSADGKLLATGSQDQTIRLWDVATGDCLQVYVGHASWIRCVAFSPDRQTLASGSADGVLKLWRVNTGQCSSTVQAHGSPVLSIAYHPKGETLATASADTTIKLWQPSTQQCYRVLEGHEKWVRHITFSDDGVLASCSQDETIRLWQMDGNCVAVLRVTRPYEGMNITETTGLTVAQKNSLKQLGAIETS